MSHRCQNQALRKLVSKWVRSKVGLVSFFWHFQSPEILQGPTRCHSSGRETPPLKLPFCDFLMPQKRSLKNTIRTCTSPLWKGDRLVSVTLGGDLYSVEYTGKRAGGRQVWTPWSFLGPGPCWRMVLLNPSASPKLPFCSPYCGFGNFDTTEAKHSENITLPWFFFFSQTNTLRVNILWLVSSKIHLGNFPYFSV